MSVRIFTLAMLLAGTGMAGAQSASTKQSPPGPAGADSNVYNQGIARDPGEVQAQQGQSSKASPGTVGAAPGADTKSQNHLMPGQPLESLGVMNKRVAKSGD